MNLNIDNAIKNLIKRIDEEIPENDSFDKMYEFIDNTDSTTGLYVDRFSIDVYNMPVNIQPDRQKHYIDVTAYGKDVPYKASTLITCGSNSEIKDYLKSPKGRQEIIESLIEQAESIRCL